MTPQVEPKHREFAEPVMEYAEQHYADGGWDVVVECWTLDEIAEYLAQVEAWGGEINDVDQAVDALAGLASVWRDRQADAGNWAF